MNADVKREVGHGYLVLAKPGVGYLYGSRPRGKQFYATQ
jgi:hypothetical protein